MWSRVIGQQRVKRVVKAAIQSQKLPSAYLFSGPDGVGKDAAAIEVAKALNCLAPIVPGEACDECTNCQAIASFASTHFTIVFALAKDVDAAGDASQRDADLAKIRDELHAKSDDPYYKIEIPRATTIQIGQIRELRLLLSRSTDGPGRRVVLISAADQMNAQAQNALLKTLEEPHENAMLILTSGNPSRLLPTILSRCQDIRFDTLRSEEIEQALIEREGMDKAQAKALSRIAAGSYTRARSLSGEDVQAMRAQIVDFLRMGLSRSRKSAAQQMDQFVPRATAGHFLEKRQAIEQRLTLITLWLRDALALATGAEQWTIINQDQIQDLTKFTSRFSDPTRIARAIHSVEKAQSRTQLQLQQRPILLQLVVELEEALL